MIPACNLPIEDLVAFAEGELPGDLAKIVENHLRICPTCQQRLETLKWVDQKLQASPLIDDVDHRIAIDRKLKDALHQLAPRKRRHTLLPWVYTGVFLVLLVFLIVTLLL